MIGTKFYKEDLVQTEYQEAAEWCNTTQLGIIEDKGEYYEVVAVSEVSLEELKNKKFDELKEARDEYEVRPILSNGHLFDYDEKARDRINAAIIALDLIEGSKIMWTLANDASVEVTANDLRQVIADIAIRSNQLHIRYRQLKELLNAAITKEEVEAISWYMELPEPVEEPAE